MNVLLLTPSIYSDQQKIKKNLISKGFDLRPQFIDWARELTPQEKRLLETMFDFVQDKQGWSGIYPSVKTLAWRSQMSLRNCHRVKTSLKRKGYIDWITIRDKATKQLKCHFVIKEKVMSLTQRNPRERFKLPQLVKPFFDSKGGGDNLSQPVMPDCHINKYINLPSEGINLGILSSGKIALGLEGKNPTRGEEGGGQGEPRTKESFSSFPSENIKQVFEETAFTEKFSTKGTYLPANPPPQSPPARAAEMFLPNYLRKVGGLVRMEIESEGVRVRVQVPVSQVSETLAAVTSGRRRSAAKKGSVGGNPHPKKKTLQKANKRESVESKSMDENDLPFSKAKQLRKEPKAEVSREEKQKAKAKEYRENQYQRQKERLAEMKASGQMPKRTESKKEVETKQQATQLFQFFLARCKERNLESHSQSLEPLERWCAAKMIERIGMHDAEVAITWALDNWQWLLEKDDKLSRDPYFHNLTAYHRFTYYLRKATVETIKATQKEASNHKAKGFWGGKSVRGSENDHS